MEKVSKLWEDWENGKAYQSAIGLSERVRNNINFFEGRQWAPATEATKNFPRPVFNFIRMICRNKISNILAKPVKIVYKSYANKAGAEKFTNFATYIQKEIKQEELDADAINDGAKKGAYFFHYYWDAEAKGKKGIKEGALRCHLVDIENIVFSNPKELDIQRNKYIIISSREEVEAVRASADSGVETELISADDNDSYYDNSDEQKGSELCTVLTRYFKRNGEVYFERATKFTIVNKARPLTPDIEGAKKELGFARDVDKDGMDAEDGQEPAAEYEEDKGEERYRATLYPIAAGQYEKSENCVYGLSEVEGLIPNQKAVNFSIAMKLLAEQNQSMGKFIAKEGALQDQEITNDPAEVLIDYYKGGQGFYTLPAPQITSAQMSLSGEIINLSRNLHGATEVMSGELPGSNMSGAAIAQLQSQAQMPVEELRKRFWRVKEKQGRILEQFFKLFYEDKEFVYKDGDEEKTDVFNGAEFTDEELSVVVEAVGGTRASTAADIQILTDLAAKQIISPLAFVSALPDDFISNKSELIKIVKEEAEGREKALLTAVQQAQEQIKQLSQAVQAQSEIVNKAQQIVGENHKLKQQLIEVQAEKIEQADVFEQTAAGAARLIKELSNTPSAAQSTNAFQA